jgi:hypothetical protein
MTKSVEDKIHTQVHSLARLLGMRDRQLHGELTEYLPPAVIMEACMKVGVQMSDSQLEDLMNQCTMEVRAQFPPPPRRPCCCGSAPLHV